MDMIQTLTRRLAMTAGHTEADVCITNARVVDVYSGLVQENVTVRMGAGVFLGFTPGPARTTVNAMGRYLVPGLMDAHVHIESSMLCPSQFARLVLPLGTTTVIADPHEIANVLGLDGIRYMLNSSAELPLDVRIMLPSCVPATPFEHSGAVLMAADLAALMEHPRVMGLGEMMNYPGVVNADSDVLAKIALAQKAGKVVDGHAPSMSKNMGEQAHDAYIGAGITTEHECETVEEMHQCLRRGMYIAIRQGSAAHNLPTLVKGVTLGNVHRCVFCTDDRHAGDILENGHINYLLRLAVKHGLDPLLAVRMASLNVAQCYGLRHKGGIAPGLDADCVLVEDLRDFQVLEVYAKGRKVAEQGRLCVPIDTSIPPEVIKAVRSAPLEADDLRLPLPTGRARVIGVQPESIVSKACEYTVHTVNGYFDAAANPGLTKIAVIERHKRTGFVGVGLLAGYSAPGTLLGGTVATTIAHDSHNIVVAGDSDSDMRLAVEDLRRMGGGITLVRDGKVLDHLALPVAGLMSAHTAEEVHDEVCRVLARAKAAFSFAPGVEPFMSLSFMSLAVIPELKLTDQGLFDVRSFCFVPVSVD